MKQCRIKVSWLWIPFLFCCVHQSLWKTMGFLFVFLSVHETAHILMAYCFHYPIRKVILYPFGLCALIDSLGYQSGIKDALILMAGPASQLLEPFLLKLFLMAGMISQSYYEYLCMMNLSIMIFNLLPIYPLDGGRMIELLLELVFPYLFAGKLTNICSMILIVLLYAYHLFAGISGLAVCILLFMENIMAFQKRAYQRAKLYEYRRLHPSHYPIRMNKGHDFYRFSTNIMHKENQWMTEQDWLRYFT